MSVILTAEGATLIEAEAGAVILRGAGIDFYEGATNHIKFTGYTGFFTPGANSRWVWVLVAGAPKLILTVGGTRIALYWDPDNAPAWVTSHSYAVGNKVVGAAAPDWLTAHAYYTGNLVVGSAANVCYRCISNHTSSAGDRPTSGGSWATYWALRDDLSLIRLYRCKVAHTSAANTKPPNGVYYSSYWELRNDLDDGRKFVYIDTY